MRSLYALCAPLAPKTCAKRANVCAHATKTQCRPASACARVWQHVGTTRTHRTPKQKTHAPHRKQTHHTATRYANATPCTHELDSAAHGVATRERERENPKRKINKTAAARCVQRCCCAVRVVRYRLHTEHSAHGTQRSFTLVRAKTPCAALCTSAHDSAATHCSVATRERSAKQNEQRLERK